MGRYTSGGVTRDILAGAVAGVAAIWIADKLDNAIYRAGGPEGARRTEAARPGGMDPAHVLAKRAADAVGADLGDPKDNAAGHTVHYGIAAGMGALYGLLRGAAPAVSAGRGALFGFAMFILQDEVGNAVLGTSGSPFQYPFRDHVRGAAAHTLFGVATDFCTRILSPWRDEVVIEQGPPLSERLDRGRDYLQTRGRLALEQGRGYLDQGVGYAGQVADSVRARVPDSDAATDAATGVARAGYRRAQRFAADAGSRLADVDPARVVSTGRRQASRFASDARAAMPDVPTSGISRALERLFG